MKHQTTVKFAPEIIILVLLALFFITKKPYNPWDRVIRSDGTGYYAYLPAIFIYQDPKLGFIDDIKKKYYPENSFEFQEFRNQTNDYTVNKFFYGLSLLWLPFFLLAHLFTNISGWEADGFSILYQYAIGISCLFYLWIGLRYLRKIFIAFKIPANTAFFIMLLLGFGTNLLQYAIWDNSLSHVYNFTIITVFVYCLMQVYKSFDAKWFIMAGLLLGLIIAIRPQNGLIVLIIPFVAGSRKSLARAWKHIKIFPGTLLKSLLIFLIPIFIQSLLWKWQTGEFLVYSYGDEKFNFYNPQFLKILFSYQNGWFIYTPVAFISLTGMIYLFRNNLFRFIWLMVFFMILIYVFSSWWCWWYGACYGLRAFIDFYVITGILLGFSYKIFNKFVYLKISFTIILILLIMLNLLKIYQHNKAVIPTYKITSELYWENFFSLLPKARVNIPQDQIQQTVSIFLDMEGGSEEIINRQTLTDNKSFQGKYSSVISDKQSYSAGINSSMADKFSTQKRKIKVSCWLYSTHSKPESRLIIEFFDNEQTLSYHPSYLHEYIPEKKWTYVEFLTQVPSNINNDDRIKLYFWNPGNREVIYIDSIKIEFLSM